MATVAVVGGGISGLTAAYYLHKYGGRAVKKVLLLEGGNHVGGWMRSTRFPDGSVHEHGPRSIRPVGPSGASTLQLVEDLGLGDAILPIKSGHPSAKNRLILVDDRLLPLPASVGALFRTTPPFSRPLALALVKDLVTRRELADDESMYSFAHRRLGEEVAKYAIDPLCRGVVAGDAREISVLAILRPLFEAEQQHGSIVKGMVKNMVGRLRKTEEVKAEEAKECGLVKRAKSEGWRMWSLRNGLQVLPDAIATSLRSADGVTVRLGSRCEGLEFHPGRVEVKYSGGKESVDHVIAALPAKELSTLLPPANSGLGGLLAAIDTVSVATVGLEYNGHLLNQQAFGFLVPSSQKSDILGVIYDSCNFPQHNGEGGGARTKLTVMMGGRWFERLLGDPAKADEDRVLTVAKEAVGRHLGIGRDPLRHHVLVQRDCIPQYVVGHFRRLSKIRSYVEGERLPVTLIGSSYDGVSVNDCVHHARRAVASVLAGMRRGDENI